jgi:DNA-binding NarL/FixJ family response regulator
MLEGTMPDGRQRLSAREVQVIEMATLGLTNAQMADRLTVTSYAIKFHLSSIYRKLGVANRTEAAVAYLHLQHNEWG